MYTRARTARQGELLQKVAGVLMLEAGVLIVLAVPVSVLLAKGLLGLDVGNFFRFGLCAVCSAGVHILLAIGAFWGGYRCLRFTQEGGSTIVLLAICSALAGVFLFGTIPDLIAGASLMWAAVMVFLS